MTNRTNQIDVYLETGKKHVVAGVVAWPGWCRVGRDQASALQALFDYGPRFAQIFESGEISFTAPADPSQFNVAERLMGNATTDFGAPGMVPECDQVPLLHDELQRYLMLLTACYQAFDNAVAQATGKELRKGPRGGGRELNQIVAHVVDAEIAYLPRVAWTFKRDKNETPTETMLRTRQAVLDALTSAVEKGLPERGPRGGVIWPAQYFVRRVAWHVLDHLWEIQDRVS